MQHIDPKKLARELLEPQQYKCFAQLIGKESAWRSVNNPESSAKGVGQLLAGTYKNLGMRHPESKVSQTIAALAYIGRRYGSGGPCAAWSHWQEKKTKTGYGWY
jgi:SLT domain-containing protein